VLEPLERPWWRGRVIPQDSPYGACMELLQKVNDMTREVQEGRADADTTATELLRLLREADFVPPAWGLADPDNQWTDASFLEIGKTLRWAKKTAPRGIGELTYEGLTLFMKKRFSRGEFAVAEELKHALARWPVVGKRLRVPEPK
jgi:FADH2 O2-dependent halogenase